MTVSLPESIQIGPVAYAVRERDDLHTVDGDGKKAWLNGQILYSEAEIRVAADQADVRKVITLWHEALHGILDQAGLDKHDEQAIIALGFGLVQLVRDNPALVALTVGRDGDKSDPA
jgi:hypothetical protein